MNYREAEKMLDGVSDWFDYGKHEPLVSLSCVYEDFDHDASIEVVFAVPIGWLNAYKSEETSRLWDWGDTQDWLVNKYTSEDSQPILERAIAENKVAFWKIN